MEQAEIFQILSMIGFAVSGALCVTAVILFFRLKVPQICGELSGRNARKQIEEYRAKNGGTVTKEERRKARKQKAKKPKTAAADRDSTELLDKAEDSTEMLDAAEGSTEMPEQPESDATEIL